jgi:hypothetical protein
MAEHITLSHHILLQDTGILSIKSGHTDRISRKVIKIKHHSSNMNREVGFSA